MIEKVNLAEKFGRFDEHWSPKIAGGVNDTLIKLVKVKGPFIWHRHEREDEMFLVWRGRLRMMVREHGREREIMVAPGEFIIIPRGIEHMPIADEETEVVLVEAASTLNTGTVANERTVTDLERI